MLPPPEPALVVPAGCRGQPPVFPSAHSSERMDDMEPQKLVERLTALDIGKASLVSGRRLRSDRSGAAKRSVVCRWARCSFPQLSWLRSSR